MLLLLLLQAHLIAQDVHAAIATGGCKNQQPNEMQALLQTHGGTLRSSLRHSGVENEADFTFWMPKTASLLETYSLAQDLRASVSEDGQTASVSFKTVGNKSFQYQMKVHSVYGNGARLVIWNGTGKEFRDPGPSRIFKGREHGKWAQARIHEDGSVSGLFEQHGQVFDVRPLRNDHKDPAFSLLSQHAGNSQAHVFSMAPPLDLSVNPSTAFSMLQRPPKKRTIDDDDEDGPDEDGDMPTPAEGDLPHPPSAFDADPDGWGGVKWYPGCYPGDDVLNTIMVGFAIPPNIFSGGSLEHWPTVDDAKVTWEEIITKSSWIYEKQLNVQLRLGDVAIALTQEGAPEWAQGEWNGCEGEIKGFKKRLEKSLIAMNNDGKDDLPSQQATWHGFMNCGEPSGNMGRAGVGTLCKYPKGKNCGTEKWHSPITWFVFAHELGHNFNGKHSFEDGQGVTGGVMDYGDGKLNGHFQFNTKYRKKEMCKGISIERVNKCEFWYHGATSPPDLPPPGFKLGQTHVKLYVMQEDENSADCPANSEKIQLGIQCKRAARDLADTYGGEWDASWGNQPGGCFAILAGDYKGFYFMSTAGKPEKGSKTVCKLLQDGSTPAAPAPAPPAPPAPPKAEPAPPAPSPVPTGGFQLSDANKNECPAGSTGIEDLEGCKAGASSLGLTFKDEDSTAWLPKGCYYYTAAGDFKGVWFSTANPGAAESDSKLVCKK